MINFKGEHVWIIGASSGIGKALAIELAGRGAVLALSARSLEKLGDIALTLGPAHTFHALDVTKPSTIEKALSDMPRIPDRIIYTAGYYEPMKMSALNLSQSRDIIDINFTGVVNVVALIMPHFLKRNSGQIAITASVAGYRGLPRSQPYGATKAALINFTQSLFLETRNTGLDIKLINPGFVRTPMTGKNDFKMPMMIEAEDAARRIADGLVDNSFEIHFPKRFSLLMKLISFVPFSLFAKVAAR